jgi:hypothetical protein
MSPSLASRLDLTVEASGARGDHRLHLSRGGSHQALCGRPTHRGSLRKRFREAGCPQCLEAALGSGRVAAQEGRQTWINLARV